MGTLKIQSLSTPAMLHRFPNLDENRFYDSLPTIGLSEAAHAGLRCASIKALFATLIDLCRATQPRGRRKTRTG